MSIENLKKKKSHRPHVLTLRLLHCIGVTAVKFQHVHPPVCKSLGVRLDVVQRGAGVAAARERAHVPVDPQLQTLVVHVLSQFRDATWEAERGTRTSMR